MGADLLICSLSIKQGRAPDLAAAKTAIDALRPEQVENPDEFFDHDPETAAGLAAIRFELHTSLSELESALQYSRELGWIECRGLTVYLTGGLSTGDAPTELFDTFTRLHAVPVVLAAAGFEVEA